MKIEYPALIMSKCHVHGGVKNYRELARCGVMNLENGAFIGWKIYDSKGCIFVIKAAKKGKLTNPLNPFNIFKEYRGTVAELEYEMSDTIDFNGLKEIIYDTFMSKKLDGAPFDNKDKEIKAYLNEFKDIKEIVTGLGYFSYK